MRPGSLTARLHRSLVLLVPLTAVVLTAGLLAPGAAPGVRIAGVPVPGSATPASAATASRPMMFGAVGNSRTTVMAHERVLGRKLRGLRVYKRWDEALFGGTQTWARDTGHTLFLSIDSERKNGRPVMWADVANAKPGSAVYADLQRQAAQIKAFKAQVFIAYNHEPDTHWSASLGSPAQFIAAWRRVISVYRAAGVRNAQYVWVLTAYSFRRTDGKRAQVYYPGDGYVDDIAADGYNWYRCKEPSGNWADVAKIFDGQRKFGAQHPDKGLMIWEFSSTEDQGSPGRKARWLHDVENLFRTSGWRQYKVLLSWEGRSSAGKLNCRFDYLSSPSATTAWKALGTDPAFSATRIG
jgi:hypothetical protein